MDDWRREAWARRRDIWMKRMLVRRVVIWAAIVSVLIVINLAVGGRMWSLGIAAIMGGLLLLRVALIYFFSRRRPSGTGPWRRGWPPRADM